MPPPKTKCSICDRSLGKADKPEVTTICGHTFHRICAEGHSSKSYNCPECNKTSALKNALKPEKAAPSNPHGASPSVSKHKDTKDKDKWRCTYCTLENLASATRCEVCNNIKPAASSTASVASVSSDKKSKSTDHHGSYDQHDDSADSDKDNDNDNPSSRFSQQWNRQDSGTWICDECNYENRNSDMRCKECNERKSSGDHKKYSVPSSKRSPTSSPDLPAAPKSGSKSYSRRNRKNQSLSSCDSSSDREIPCKP